jgi:predicted thioesterase
MIAVRHLAAAPANASVDARARLLSREGRRLTFSVEVHWGDVVLMSGTHERAIVNLARFLARLPTAQ